MTTRSESAGFAAFFRRYTRTWQHALATAALTAFGTLTVVHRGFALVAVATYVLVPIGLYLTRTGPAAEAVRDPDADSEESDETDGSQDAAVDGSDRGSDAGRGGTGRGSESYWTAVEPPTDASLFDVTVTGSNAYAVGADGVVVADEGDGWRTVLADGPGADSKTLRGADATDGGVWFAGDGGALGRLETETGRHVDYSAPIDRTDTWEDVAVTGSGEDERLLLVNGSGEVLRGRYRDGELAWDGPVKPGSGSSLSGAALADASVGYVCDTNDGVFETTDGGETFRRIGVEGVDGTFTDLATTARGDCTVSADDGVLHRHDGGTWTPVRLGDDPLEAVAFRGEYGVACGNGAVYERTDQGAGWERNPTPDPGPFVGVAVGAARAVAVGNDGAVVERRDG